MAGTLDHAFFYNSENGDREYDAESFTEWLRKFFTTGVFLNELQVKAGEGMQVTIDSGYANIGGKVKLFADTSLDVTTANSTYDRIDTVVVERNDTQRDFVLKVVTGSATDSPTAKAPVREGAIYQLVLAHVLVEAGSTSILQANITDKRSDPDLCGFVASTVDQIDFSQVQAQFDAYMADYKVKVSDDYAQYNHDITSFETEAEALFNAWFATIQGILDEETAGHLMNEVNDLKDGRSGLSQAKTTTFPTADSIVETYADGKHLDTVFKADGSIEEKLYASSGTVLWSKTTTYDADGSIKEVMNG